MKKRFDSFSDDELYVLKRQAIESSYEIVMSGKYEEHLVPIHNKLLNEVIDEICRREANVRQSKHIRKG